MRKAPKRGHRVMTRTLNCFGLPAFRGLRTALPRWHAQQHVHVIPPPVAFPKFNPPLPAQLPKHLPDLLPHLAMGGFLAIVRYHHHRVLTLPRHVGLTQPFFSDGYPGPGGAFLKGTILFKIRTKRQSLVNAHRQCRWLTELQFG